MILLGKNPGVVQTNANVPTNEEVAEEFILNDVLKQAEVKTNLKMEEMEYLPEDDISESDTSSITTEPTLDNSIQAFTEKDGLVYIAGYLARKYKKEYPNLGSYTYQDEESTFHTYCTMPSWVKNLSFGGLTEPSPEWLKNVECMDRYFVKVHKNNFRFKKRIVGRTTTYIYKKLPDVPRVLIKAFVRQRTFVKIKYSNTQKKLKSYQNSNNKRKSNENDVSRKVTKKFKKTIT